MSHRREFLPRPSGVASVTRGSDIGSERRINRLAKCHRSALIQTLVEGYGRAGCELLVKVMSRVAEAISIILTVSLIPALMAASLFFVMKF